MDTKYLCSFLFHTRTAAFTAVLGVLAISSVCAQQAGGDDTNTHLDNGAANGKGNLADTKVDVNVEEARLSDVVKLLMGKIGANYTLDPALRGATVTANLHELRFSIALETVLKASTISAQANYENGVYFIRQRIESESPAIEAGPTSMEEPAESRFRLDTIKVDFIDAGQVARLLGGTSFDTIGQTFGFVPYPLLGVGLTLNPSGGNGTGISGSGGAGNASGAAPPLSSSFYANGGGALIINRGRYSNSGSYDPLRSPLYGDRGERSH